MEPLAVMCTAMQSQDSIDWGFHCPIIDRLFKLLERVDDLKYCEVLKQSVLKSVRTRFPEYKCAYNLVATALHPAFKKSYITSNISGVDIEAVVDKIVLEMDLMDLSSPTTHQPSQESKMWIRSLHETFLSFTAH